MLSEHPRIEYFEDGKRVGEPKLCLFTNEEAHVLCADTNQCTHHNGSTNQASKQSKQNSSTNQGSKLVMVATHRNLQDQCPGSREENNIKQALA